MDGTLYPNLFMYLYSIPFFLTHPVFVYHFRMVRKTIRTIRPLENVRNSQADLLSRSMGISREQAYNKIDTCIYNRWERCFRYMILYPWVKKLISLIRLKGLKTGILSDYPVDRKLSYFGLSREWDVAMSSEESGYLKPHPEPFLLLAERMNLPPEKILYIGNSYAHDIIGASGVGMRTAHLSWKRERKGADITFLWYKEIERYLSEKL